MRNDILNIIHADLQRNPWEKRETEIRRQHYLDQCAEHGIKFRVHAGFTDELQPFHNINKSHKKVIRLAKEEGLPYCLIAEDDFQITGPGGWKYYLENMPDSFDLYCAVIYAGTVQDLRVLSPFSGGMILYTIHSRFFQTVLDAPSDVHLDRYLGSIKDAEIVVPKKYCCKNKPGYSFHTLRYANYGVYEEGKDFYEG